MTRQIQIDWLLTYFYNKDNIHRARMVNRFSKMFETLKDEARSGDLETDLSKLADKSIDTLYNECLESLSDPVFKTIEQDEEEDETEEITEEEFNELNSDIL